MQVAVTGGTGFIGRALVKALRERGDEVIVISRARRREGKHGYESERWPAPTYVTWDSLRKEPGRLEGTDAVVNLAGETINQRWTAAAKSRILQSRLNATDSIGTCIQNLHHKPKLVINASGINAYGYSREKQFDETSPVQTGDFLSSVVHQWEEAAARIKSERLIVIRFGIVLGMDGGALPKMLLPYRLFAGGRMGDGGQWISWIHRDDLVRLILFALDHPSWSGPVNGTAPNAVTSEQFGQAAARAMRRPHWLSVPSPLLKLALGEMSELLLCGQRVLPAKAESEGFRFQYPSIETAMENLLHK